MAGEWKAYRKFMQGAFRAGVGNAKSWSLRIPLRRAVSQGAHHDNVAAMLGGITQSAFHQRQLRTLVPRFRNGARTGPEPPPETTGHEIWTG